MRSFEPEIHLPIFLDVTHSPTEAPVSLQTIICLNWLGILNKCLKSKSFWLQSHNCSLVKQMEWLSSAPFFKKKKNVFFSICWVIAYKVYVVLKIFVTRVSTRVILIFTWSVLKPSAWVAVQCYPLSNIIYFHLLWKLFCLGQCNSFEPLN